MALALVTYFWVYPLVSSFFPRTFDVNSSSLVVEGKYYSLALDGVNRVYLANGCMGVDGFDIHGFAPVNQAPQTRDLPAQYSAITEPDSSWAFVGGMSSSTGFTQRLFVRATTNDTIIIQLPAMNDLPDWVAYSGVEDTTLILVASGNWKQSQKVYLGYIVAYKQRS